MALQSWLAFVAATAVLLVIPGPTVMLVISYGLGQGWRAALPTAIGVALGDFTAMTLAMIGVGGLLAASATVFAVLKWAGAAYLIVLGIRLWRSHARADVAPARPADSVTMAAHAFAVTALNPKSMTFFVAFLPQFVDPAADFMTQMAVFEGTFVALAFINALGYAVMAARGHTLVTRPQTTRLLNKAGGAVLIGAGLAVAVGSSQQ